MSDHVFSTKPGAADGLELGKPLGGGSSLTNTSDLTSSGGTTGLTGSQGLTGSHGLTGGSSDPARNVADTPAGVAAGLGAGHHNQGGIHAPGSGAGGLTSGSAGGLAGTTDRLAQATATSGNTHTGAIGGNPVSRNDNLTDYNDKNIVTPNIGSGQTSSHGHGATGAALGAGAAGAGAAGLASRGTHDHSHDSTTTGKDGFNTAPVIGSGTTGHNHLHTGAALEGLTGKPSGHRVEPAELQREDRLGTAADHGAAGRGLSGTGVHDDGVPAADRHGALHGAGVGAQNTTAGDRGLTGSGHGGPTAYESDASRVGGHGHGAAAGAGLGAGALAAGGAAAAGHHSSSTGVTPGTHGYGSATQGSGVGHGVVGTAGGADATDANRGTGLTGRGGAAGAAAGLAGAGAATGLSGGNASNSVDALKQELKEHQSGSSHGTHPESQGPHGLVWHNGKYVHQREIDQHGSTGVPLANAFKDPKSGGEHGVNTDTNANNTRV